MKVAEAAFGGAKGTLSCHKKVGRKWLFTKGMMMEAEGVRIFLLTNSEKPNIINSFQRCYSDWAVRDSSVFP